MPQRISLLTFIRGPYGDIAYAKSWSGFADPRKSTGPYITWREHIKAYLTAMHFDPASMTSAEWDQLLLFVKSLSPVRQRVEMLRKMYRPDDLEELDRHLKLLVKDIGKKLQTTNQRLYAALEERKEDQLIPGKRSQ